MITKRYGQDGFSLLSVVVASLIMTISFLFISQILLQTQVIGQQQDRFAQFNDLRDDVMSNLANECSITNTVLAPENREGMKCLYEGECRPGEESSLLNLRNDVNEEIYGEQLTRNRLLNSQGAECVPDRGDCTHEFDMQYTLKCADGNVCKMPFLLVEGKFREYQGKADSENLKTPAKVINYNMYRFEKQVTYTPPYKNCKEVMSRGLAQSPSVQMASGIYTLDPDGAGGECPFRVYCDLAPTSDGGGWALVANQTLSSQSLPERAPPLYQGMAGRLEESLLKVMLENSASPGSNNVRIKLDTRRSGKLVLSFSIPKAANAGIYQTAQTFCKSVDLSSAESTTVSGAGNFGFMATSPAVSIGYKDHQIQCNSCDPGVANPVCTELPNAGCCSKETPTEATVWIR